MDSPEQDSEVHTEGIPVDLGRVGLVEDNRDNVHAADRDHVVADSLDSVEALELAVVAHQVFPVVLEPEDPGWKQFGQQKMSVEAPADLHDSYPPVVDWAAADETG